MEPNQDVKQLVKSEDGVRGLVIGNRVYDPLLFSRRVVRFSAKQYRFLQAYRLGTPLHEAAEKANLTIEQVDRFLKRESTRAWLRDRAEKDHIKSEWEEPGKWWALGNEVLEGKKQFSKAQIVVFQEFGNRVCPKAGVGSDSAPKIQINIDPSAVQEAFRRQQSIEAEIVKEQAA